MNSPKIHSGRESGQAVLLVIVGLSIFLIGALGLALDGAQMYAQQQMARAAADAGAQAGILSIYRGTNATAPNPFGTGANPAAFTCSTSRRPNSVRLRAPQRIRRHRLGHRHGEFPDDGPGSFESVLGRSRRGDGQHPENSSHRTDPIYRAGDLHRSGQVPRPALIASGPDCITVLSPSGNGALSVSNNATLSLHNCGLTVNSSAPQALTVSNNASAFKPIRSRSCGGYSSRRQRLRSHRLRSLNAPPAADPFASVPAPAYSASPCFQNTVVTNNATAVLSPGVYCGGITVSNNASVTFNPGVYILLGGGLNVSNNGTLTGQNVTFYNTFDGTHPFAPISLSNNVTATLSATISGALQGILFFEDRNAPSGFTENFDNNSSQIFVGRPVLSQKRVLLSNNGSLGHRNMAIVANTVQISNNASLLISLDLSEAGAPQMLGIALVK